MSDNPFGASDYEGVSWRLSFHHAPPGNAIPFILHTHPLQVNPFKDPHETQKKQAEEDVGEGEPPRHGQEHNGPSDSRGMDKAQSSAMPTENPFLERPPVRQSSDASEAESDNDSQPFHEKRGKGKGKEGQRRTSKPGSPKRPNPKEVANAATWPMCCPFLRIAISTDIPSQHRLATRMLYLIFLGMDSDLHASHNLLLCYSHFLQPRFPHFFSIFSLLLYKLLLSPRTAQTQLEKGLGSYGVAFI